MGVRMSFPRHDHTDPNPSCSSASSLDDHSDGDNNVHLVPPGFTADSICLTRHNRARLRQAFLDQPWLVGLHVTTNLDTFTTDDAVVAAAHGLSEFAHEIDSLVGERRIQVLSLGPLYSDTQRENQRQERAMNDCQESMRNYFQTNMTRVDLWDHLYKSVPNLFDRSSGRVIVTDWGASVSAHLGWTIGQVLGPIHACVSHDHNDHNDHNEEEEDENGAVMKRHTKDQMRRTILPPVVMVHCDPSELQHHAKMTVLT